MKSEYVGISGEEKIHVQKTFLESELSLLQISRSLEFLRKTRKEEFVLKIAFKSKVEELLSSLIQLERMLPKSSFKFESAEDRQRQKSESKNLGLQREIESIRQKIENLQKNF